MARRASWQGNVSGIVSGAPTERQAKVSGASEPPLTSCQEEIWKVRISRKTSKRSGSVSGQDRSDPWLRVQYQPPDLISFQGMAQEHDDDLSNRNVVIFRHLSEAGVELYW